MNASHAARLTGVYSGTLQRIATRRNETGFELAYLDRWVRTLRVEGFEVDETTFAVTDPSGPAVGFTADALAALTDAGVIHDHLARLGEAVDTDPRLAVSTAKALIESVVLPAVLRSCAEAGLSIEDVVKHMRHRGHDDYELRQLRRWENKRLTGKLGR